MALKHADIWRAIDSLAEREGLSPSGLAKKAGLSPTTFNPGKRISSTRKRWPSTESIAQILHATGTGLDDFLLLASPDKIRRPAIPFLRMTDAGRVGMFDEEGHPVAKGWDGISFPVLSDPHAFALETEKEMKIYPKGATLVVSPAEKPRRGDRVIMMVKKEGLRIGELTRETAQKIGLDDTDFPRGNVEWMHRIVWASQ